jgi:large subunit ribosomal protein L30
MLKITLIRSVIGAKPVNRKTVSALGLRKTGRTIYREDVPSIRGMIHNVRHLVKVETVDSAPAKVAKPKKVKAATPAPKVEKVAVPAAKKPKEAKKPKVAKQPKQAKQPAAKKEASKPAAKKPAPKAPARKADTQRKSFGEVGKKKK